MTNNQIGDCYALEEALRKACPEYQLRMTLDLLGDTGVVLFQALLLDTVTKEVIFLGVGADANPLSARKRALSQALSKAQAVSEKNGHNPSRNETALGNGGRAKRIWYGAERHSSADTNPLDDISRNYSE